MRRSLLTATCDCDQSDFAACSRCTGCDALDFDVFVQHRKYITANNVDVENNIFIMKSNNPPRNKLAVIAVINNNEYTMHAFRRENEFNLHIMSALAVVKNDF